MNKEYDYVIFMYTYIRRCQYGEFRNKFYRKSKYEFKRDTKWVNKCPSCGIKINGKNHTIDHVIPLWVCREYNMPQLEFDKRNFAVLCTDCNTRRGNVETTFDKLTLSEEVKSTILRGIALNK